MHFATQEMGTEFKFVPRSDCGQLIDAKQHPNDLLEIKVLPAQVNLMGYPYAPGDH
jgi:hypothetical protein